ncbi:MAG: YgaP family membrane protein [Desulfurivibrionaceae bacterium]
MKQNMGTMDRIIRTSLALVVAILYFTDNLSGLAAIVLGIFAVVFLLTSLVGFCPLYTVLGIKTTKDK